MRSHICYLMAERMVNTMKLDLIEARERTIVKANALIQQSRFSLSVVQQKIVLYLISRIKPDDDDFQLYEFGIADFCRICGIDYDNGKNYISLKAAIKAIADKSMWIKLPDGRETLVRWIERPYINDGSGMIQIKLDKEMKPYLLRLKENFTRYELVWTLRFRSKYAIRLYEILCSMHYHELEERKVTVSVPELKRMMDAETYKDWVSFRRRALDVAVQEITRFSDKIVSYVSKKTGKTITAVEFTITTKSMAEIMKLKSDIHHELGIDENQMTIWDELEAKGIVN